MKKYILIFFILTLIVCCKTKNSQNAENNSKETFTLKTELIKKDTNPVNTTSGNSLVVFKTKLTDSTSNIPYYQCDDYNAFQIELDIKSINSLYEDFFSCTKVPVINKYDQTIVDTIYMYTNEKNLMEFYRSSSNGDFLMLFDITDSLIEINNGIKTGLSKIELARKFNIKNIDNDTLDVGNLENTNVIRFYFKDSLLTRIKFEPYFE
ncbi:hypothetical protein ACE1ET_20375 [Saccharicrinis sp. FJH62]|uniref:hypothetical protein n=1 Tax=Saccharicrinis sp. FJH62 TaxID=3344657 RepID=UPI0035D49E40